MKRDRKFFKNKLIDCHTHCEGLALYNFLNGLTPCSADSVVLAQTIIDSKIDFAITFPMPWTLYYDSKEYIKNLKYKPSGLCEIPYEIENIRILKTIKRNHYDIFLPFVAISLNDKVSEQIKLISDLMQEHNIYGIKYHTQTDRHSAMDISSYPELISFMEKNNFPILFHSGKNSYTDPMAVLEFAHSYPKIRVCCAHAAWFKNDFFKIFSKEKCSNLFFDIAPANSLIAGFLKNKRENTIPLLVGEITDVIQALYEDYPNHILWGTDFPYLDPDMIQSNTRTESLLRYSDYEKTLISLDKTIQHRIAGSNVLDFIFGGEIGQ